MANDSATRDAITRGVREAGGSKLGAGTERGGVNPLLQSWAQGAGTCAPRCSIGQATWGQRVKRKRAAACQTEKVVLTCRNLEVGDLRFERPDGKSLPACPSTLLRVKRRTLQGQSEAREVTRGDEAVEFDCTAG